MAYDAAKYDPNDINDPNNPNNPLKVGNILSTAAQNAVGVGRQVAAAEGRAAQGVVSAGSGSDAVVNDPLMTFSATRARPTQDTQTNVGVRPGGANDTVSSMQAGIRPQKTYQAEFSGPEGQAAGTGTIKNMTTGETFSDYAPVAQGVGSAFQQDYSYLKKPEAAPQTQGIRPQTITAPDAVKQSTMYAPDNTDQSFGGLFMQGLRMKQDKAYAAMNDEVTKNMLTNRAQNITAQTANASSANEAEKNRLLGIRGESQNKLDAAQAGGITTETAQKQKTAALIDKLTTEKDPARRKELEQQVALLQGRNITAPAQPHIGTVTDAMGQQHVFATHVDPSGGIRMTTEQEMLTPQQKLRAATQGMTTKQLTEFTNKAKSLKPTDQAAALTMAQEIMRKK